MASKSFHFLSLTLSLSLLHLSTPFTPIDNHLINCGSTTSATVDNRIFLSDLTRPGSSHLSSTKSTPLPNPFSNSSFLYATARVFTGVSRYKFSVKNSGTHLLRLHFSPFNSPNYNLYHANFTVLGNGLLLLSNFGVGFTIIKEYMLMIDIVQFELVFAPVNKSGFGFVSAIELFSAPVDLIVNGAELISRNGIEEFKNLPSQILETVHRINVGGSKVTPFNDTLWRTWVPDEEFLVLKSAAKKAITTHVPNYQRGGATREIAPDNVYMTAQVMNKDNMPENSLFNITWDFPVGEKGVKHLVRFHFCDIVSLSLNQLYFDLYINEFLAYKDLDLSRLTVHMLASPYYKDFIVDSNSLGVLRISVGPSDLSNPLIKNALLNGVEIMKIVKPVDGKISLKKKRIWVLVVSVLGGLSIFCLVLLSLMVIMKCIKKRKIKPRCEESTGWTPLRLFGDSVGTAYTYPGLNEYEALKIPFLDLKSGTNNFDKNLVIGSGGFGTVYKAVLRDNLKVAIKRGVPGSRQGLQEFHAEITVLSKIRHRHLVSLVGYCEEHSEMILVYEYMEKGPLKNHLYGSTGMKKPLSWKRRLEICIEAARGIHYLHTGSSQGGVIHRDIKSTNILLDENYVAKVADFGLSRSGPCLSETHVSTMVKGSFGYLDPEYFRRQRLTDKSDVYSFGVVLFEVLCARPAVDPLLAREEVNLGEWAMEKVKKGLLMEIVDPFLLGKIELRSLKKFGETAEKCLADYGVDRPTMGDVLWNLEHALQLHENGRQKEDRVEGSAVISPELKPSRENVDGSSGAKDSQVFSQLITKNGR